MAKVWYAGALLLALASAAQAHTSCDSDHPTPEPSSSSPVPGKRVPSITGHRGAPGYYPDHTIPGYTLAIETGVDFIEPDLCSTKDGHLVIRHEPNMIATTDVLDHPEFADRRKTATVDGKEEDGFFVSDFTLEEIKTLRAIQPLPERDQSFNGQFEIVTFEEIIELAQSKSKELGRTIGIYPETKHPTYHQELGLPIEDKMLEILEKAGWNHADAPVIIQSFESTNLKELNEKTNITLSQLVDGGSIDLTTGQLQHDTFPYDWVVAGRNNSYLDMMSVDGLAEIATYADIVSPWKAYLVQSIPGKIEDGVAVDVSGDGKVTDADFTAVPNPQIVKDVHDAGLLLHTWTFRDEPYRLALNFNNTPELEYITFFELGVDGIFSDNCKSAVPAREKFLSADYY